MSTFIKTGYWEKAYKGLKGWLDLDRLINDVIGSQTPLPADSLTQDEVNAIQGANTPSVANPFLTESDALEKATGLEVNTGTDDAKYITPKAVTDSNILQSEDLSVKMVVKLTTAEYEALSPKVSTTLYLIIDPTTTTTTTTI